MHSKFYFSIFVVLLLTACNKDPKQEGCTDPIAQNYDPSALKDDGTCQYNQAEQIIWQAGMTGGWNGDLIQGAYTLNLCSGISEVLMEAPDTIDTSGGGTDSTEVPVEMPDTVDVPTPTLYLGTGAGTSHLSYFTLVNEQDARDFAEGSLRFDAKFSDPDAAPELIKLFIGGKITDVNQCEPFRRSEYVEISTQSFNDSLFSPVNITIRDFDQIMMARVDLVCGMQFETDSIGSGIEIDNLRWVANDLD